MNRIDFYNKVQREIRKKGKYVIRDPNEIIYPCDGMILCVGKRKCVRIKIK